MNRMLLHFAMPESWNLPALLRDWREDTMVFLRHDVPKILVVVIVSLVLIRVLRALTAKIVTLHIRKVPPGFRSQQVRTLATVTGSVGIFVIIFVAGLEILSLLGINLGPLLASAGIAGLAIGFGAQTVFLFCWRISTTSATTFELQA